MALDTTSPEALSPGTAPPTTARRGRSGRGRRFLGLVPLGVLVLVAVVGPFFLPHDPRSVTGPSSVAPSGEFWFGTDSAGLDVFSRTIAAFRANLLIAAIVTVLSTLGGIVLGLLIGTRETAPGVLGATVRALARLIDLVQAVPAVLVGLVAVSFYGASVTTLTVAMALVLLPIQTRLVRTEVLRVRTEGYLDAARMAGQSEVELTVRHILPNSSWAALENCSVVFAISIVLTAALGFIGVGLPPPAPEWGAMLARGATDALTGKWWSAAFPTIALAVTVTAVSLAAKALFGRQARA